MGTFSRARSSCIRPAVSPEPAIRTTAATAAGGVTLQNSQTGVVLQLAGAKVGAEVSAAVGGVTVTLE